MSGNSERPTLESSRAVFVKSCPNCKETIGYGYYTARGSSKLIIRWRERAPEIYVRLYDYRTTYKSLKKSKLCCTQCGIEVLDEKLKRMLYAIAERGFKHQR